MNHDQTWAKINRIHHKKPRGHIGLLVIALLSVASLAGGFGLTMLYGDPTVPATRCEVDASRRLISEVIYKDGSVECRYDRFVKEKKK